MACVSDRSPYRSPDEEGSGDQQLDPEGTPWRAVAGAAARGCLFGVKLGGIGGIAILLLLRFGIETPVLMPGSGLQVWVVFTFMAIAVVPTATVSAVGFGIGAIAERVRNSRRSKGASDKDLGT